MWCLYSLLAEYPTLNKSIEMIKWHFTFEKFFFTILSNSCKYETNPHWSWNIYLLTCDKSLYNDNNEKEKKIQPIVRYEICGYTFEVIFHYAMYSGQHAHVNACPSCIHIILHIHFAEIMNLNERCRINSHPLAHKIYISKRRS